MLEGYIGEGKIGIVSPGSIDYRRFFDSRTDRKSDK
jgi:hypothetical protein